MEFSALTDFPDSGQLDLFVHSRAVVLANDVIDALLAPAGTPPDAVSKLAAAMAKIAAPPEINVSVPPLFAEITTSSGCAPPPKV